MSGLSAEGFSRATLVEILEAIVADERGTISAQLDVSESTVLGNINAIFADQLSQAWEVLEEVVNGLDPDNATDSRLVALALLTGVTRRGPQKGLVTATVNLDAGTYAAGALVAHVADEPENRWVNRDAVISGGTANYSAVFESEDAGEDAVAAASTLTSIAGPVAGWNSITNAADATAGTGQETIEALRLRREQSLALAGSGTVDAIRADVLAVAGVLQVNVEENTTDVTSGVLSPHSFRAVVWDGDPGAADDDEIAQAIHGSRPAGIPSIGTESGTAVKADGSTYSVAFERAETIEIYIVCDIVSVVGVTIADVKAAILAAAPSLIGGDVIYNKTSRAVFDVEGVDDFTSFTIGIAPAPVGTSSISISATQIALFDSARITVTGDVS